MSQEAEVQLQKLILEIVEDVKNLSVRTLLFIERVEKLEEQIKKLECSVAELHAR